MMNYDECPIFELFDALDEGKVPPLRWAVENSGDPDPVNVAWKRAWNEAAMHTLLRRAGLTPASCPVSQSHYLDQYEMRCDGARADGESTCPLDWDEYDTCLACCDAIRRCVPSLPPLDELRARFAAGGRS